MILFDHANESKLSSMDEAKLRKERHDAEVRELTREAKKRFLKLEPIDSGHCVWRLMNDRGVRVFPGFREGESLACVRGFFAGNPQA